MSNATCIGCGCAITRGTGNRYVRCTACAAEYRQNYNTHGRHRGQCVQCGDDLPPRHSKFCSRDCYKQADRDRREPHPCEHCGVITGNPKYCSLRCSGTASADHRLDPEDPDVVTLWNGVRAKLKYERECHRCHVKFKVARPSDKKKFCSPTCRNPPKPPPPPKVVEYLDCCDCGQTVERRSGSHKRCSECARVRNIDRTMSLYRTAFEAVDVKRACMWRHSLVKSLRERDGDGCGLCGKEMLFDVPTGPRGTDKGATVDHILPRSLGGSDHHSNLQLAHWFCNRAKGNRADHEEQLVLAV